MKKNYLIIFALLTLVLLGAGCYGTTPVPAPEVNTPSANTSEIRIEVPGSENIPPANVNQPAEEYPKTAAVLIQSFSFAPASVTIAAGGEITWTNGDSVNHTVTGDDWESGAFGKDQTFTKKFETPGVYPYHCSLHPSMTGRVVVME
ncbi:MAG: cupredoxin family copper-binding protein [Patescibacteria group bacterium]